MQATQSQGWHKSSYSSTSRECVEVCEGPTALVRDTNRREEELLAFSAGEWAALCRTLGR